MRSARSLFLTSAVVAAALSAPSTVDATTTCAMLGDGNSEVARMLAEAIGLDASDLDDFPLSDVLGEFNTALPWLSTCAAALDPNAFVTSAVSSTSLQKCYKDIESLIESDDDSGSDSYSSAISQANKVCSLVKSSFIPCIKSGVAEVIMYNLAKTNGCCDAFLAKIQSLYGAALPLLADNLLALSHNAVCSTRNYTNLAGKAITKEPCGYSIFNSFSNFDVSTATDLIQIPNSQMCSAFEGKSFTNTKGGTSQFDFNTDGVDSMGICLTPVDSLVKYLRAMPFFQLTLNAGGQLGDFSLADLFVSGASIRGDYFVGYALDEDNLPMLGLRTADRFVTALYDFKPEMFDGTNMSEFWGDYANLTDLVAAYGSQYKSAASAFSTHITNSGSCTYSGQSLALADTSMNSTNTSATTTTNTSATMTKTSGASHLETNVLAVGAALVLLVATH